MIKTSQNIYNEFIDGKIDDRHLDKLGGLLSEYEKEKIILQEYLEKNIYKPFFCTPTIKRWLESNNKIKTIHQIRLDKGYITKNSIDNIYEEKFIYQYFKNRTFRIRKTTFRVKDIKDNHISFNCKNGNMNYEFIVTCQEFMKIFGKYVFEEDNIIKMDDSIFEAVRFVVNEQNIKNLCDEFNYALKRTKYYFEIDIHAGEIEYNDKGNKVYAIGKIETFLKKNSYLVTHEEFIIKQRLRELFKKISNWRSVEEKDKYDIGDISKITGS